MALSILDGNQSATTLSTILSSGQHITAHTVVSLGTQAITDISGAVSGSVVSISNFPASQSTTFGAVTGSVSVLNFPASQSVTFGATTGSISVLNFPASQAVTFPAVSISNFPSTQTIAGTVTANIPSIDIKDALDLFAFDFQEAFPVQVVSGSFGGTPLPISGTVTIGSALPAGTNRIGVVTIGAGTVTIGAGISQIGSVTASISGTVPISISSVTVGNSVTIGSLPAISGTVTVGALPTIGVYVVEAVQDGNGNTFGNDRDFPISGTVTANTFAVQGTAVTTSNFTSTTASTVLASFNATREVLTIFNEGAGNLHICAGATCTTIAYQVRLSAGDYYEVPSHQTTITHSAVFETAGTARVTQVS